MKSAVLTSYLTYCLIRVIYSSITSDIFADMPSDILFDLAWHSLLAKFLTWLLVGMRDCAWGAAACCWGAHSRRSGNSTHKIEHISVNPSITNERRAFRAATTPCHLREIAWRATWPSAFAPSEMHDHGCTPIYGHLACFLFLVCATALAATSSAIWFTPWPPRHNERKYYQLDFCCKHREARQRNWPS